MGLSPSETHLGDCPDFRAAKMGLSPSEVREIRPDFRGAKMGLSPSEVREIRKVFLAHSLGPSRAVRRGRGLVPRRAAGLLRPSADAVESSRRLGPPLSGSCEVSRARREKVGAGWV